MADMTQAEKVLRNRRIFDSPEGRQWVAEFLVDTKVLGSIPLDDQGAVERHNMGVVFLYDLGVIRDDSFDMLVDSMMSVPYKEEE